MYWDYNGNAYLQFVVDLKGSLPLAFLATISLLDEIARPSTVVTRWLDLLHHTRANGPVGHLDPCSVALLATYHRSWLTSRATMKDWGHMRVCSHVIHKGMFHINEFRCYEVKIEESEKTRSRQESNPGHLWLDPSCFHYPLFLPHNRQDALSILKGMFILCYTRVLARNLLPIRQVWSTLTAIKWKARLLTVVGRI